jgi:hypothetical protein
MTSSSTAHPLLASPKTTLQRRRATPIVPADTAGGASHSVRAGSVPRPCIGAATRCDVMVTERGQEVAKESVSLDGKRAFPYGIYGRG